MLKMIDAPRKFTENDFISMFIPLLRKNGIIRIDENELKKKLYCYYLKKEYKELFQDIVPHRDDLITDRMLNIDNGMLHFKNFSGMVVWDMMMSDKLFLAQYYDFDFSIYEKYLTKDGVQKINQMAQEFGIRKKIEENCRKPLNFYANNPNGVYHLSAGNNYKDEVSWELVTDGNIKEMEINENPSQYIQYDSPIRANTLISLTNSILSKVKIEDASYVLMQGIENDNIKRLKAYTNLIDSNKLRQIGEIYRQECKVMTNEKPFVKKYTLK